jgi:trehalose synthase
VREVQIDATPLERLAPLLGEARAEQLRAYVVLARTLLADRVVWNVNATASGGGVAEMLTTLLAYGRGAGVDTRWLVLEGNPRFFRITKRLHNHLHGSPGDGGPLGDAERAEYEGVLAGNLEVLRARVRPGDIVLLHDPQTAGMAAPLRQAGAHVVWRCHIGSDTHTDLTDRAWEFLRPYLNEVDATIFSREAFGPRWLDRSRSQVVPPSLDPFSTKNADLTPGDVNTALTSAGLLAKDGGRGSSTFTRRDGTLGRLREHHTLVVAGDVVPRDTRLMIQVSRWDRLKDMAGVLTAFVDHLPRLPQDVHLALVGPDVLGVSDDPEGAEVLFECVDLWKALPPAAAKRVHLMSLPMDDVDENAHLVNALQRHACLVVQKSLVEGFGLTVTEPMWKARPVIASAVGGIRDQILHGESGLLLDDPTDLDAFADLLVTVLTDDALAARLGASARERIRERFLGDRHLIQYVELFRHLLEA